MAAKLRTQLEGVWILLAIMLSGCQTTPPTSTLSPEQMKQVSLLVSLDAPVFIQRDGWKDFQPVGFGAIVYSTDLLKTEGQILLLCADMQTVKSFTSIGRNPCPVVASERVLSYDEMQFISGARGAPPSTIPYILYPRGTTILESQPALRWNDTSASSYTVEISQGITVVWEQSNVTNNEITYPATAPRLQSDRDYLLVVIDNDTGESSTADPNKGLGFQVVGEEQRAEFEKQQQSILDLTELDTSAKKIVLALYYDKTQVDGRGFWGDSNTLLAEVSQLQPNSPAVHLRLGNSLSRMKLWAEARSEYELALNTAQSLKDLESQADALVGLWHITGEQSNFDQAVRLYEEIGANDKVEALRRTEPSTSISTPAPTSVPPNIPNCGAGIALVFLPTALVWVSKSRKGL